jgi:hypothetical protein
MKRDELLTHLASLPADTDIGVQLGASNLDISEVTAWGEGAFVALGCDESDLRDVLTEWGLPADRREELVKHSA